MNYFLGQSNTTATIAGLISGSGVASGSGTAADPYIISGGGTGSAPVKITTVPGEDGTYTPVTDLGDEQVTFIPTDGGMGGVQLPYASEVAPGTRKWFTSTQPFIAEVIDISDGELVLRRGPLKPGVVWEFLCAGGYWLPVYDSTNSDILTINVTGGSYSTFTLSGLNLRWLLYQTGPGNIMSIMTIRLPVVSDIPAGSVVEVTIAEGLPYNPLRFVKSDGLTEVLSVVVPPEGISVRLILGSNGVWYPASEWRLHSDVASTPTNPVFKHSTSGRAGTVATIAGLITGTAIASGSGAQDDPYIINSTGGTGGAGDDIYNANEAATISVGGISAGYSLYNKSFEQILHDMLVVYQHPYFSQFYISGISNGQIFEVGSSLTGDMTFIWRVENVGNLVNPGGIIWQTLPGSSVIAQNFTTPASGDGFITVAAQVPWSGPITTSGLQFQITGVDTKGQQLTHDFYIGAVYPWFYGKTAAKPTIDQVLLDSGNQVLTSSTGTILVPYASMPTASTDWNWFAIPAPPNGTVKTRWYVDALNSGAIGGVNVLFPAGVPLSVSSTLWNGISYLVYVANYATALANCEMRNS